MPSFEELIDGLPTVFKKANALLRRLWTGDSTRDSVVNTVQFNTAPDTTDDLQQGQFRWNADEETLDLRMNEAVLQLGLETLYHAQNNSGGDLVSGTPVMFEEAIGASGRGRIVKADLSDPSNVGLYLGLITEDMPDDDVGKITEFGRNRGINCSGSGTGKLCFADEVWVNGNSVWVDPVNPGYLTNVKPAADKVAVRAGYVLSNHATTGTIFVISNHYDAHSMEYITYRNPYYEDLKVPLTQARQGALSKPDFDETNVGYLFPQNDATEQMFFIVQMPHAWKEGTAILPHIHWQQSAATAVTWKMDYKIVPLDGAVPAAFTTIFGNTPEFTYTSGDLSQISRIGTVDGIDMTGYGISTLLLCKVYRDDNTTTGDVLAWDIDFHYQIDTPGSTQEYIK